MIAFINKLKITIILFLPFAWMISCVEPYDVRSVNFEKALVVDGRLTNDLGKNFVKLSFTRPVDEPTNVPISGATVWVEGSDGERISFNESEAGYYKPTEGIAGTAGIEYQLFFTTKEGRKYQSGLQELIPSPPIDSIYDRYLERFSSTSGDVYKGIQFFIDAHDETNKAKYFKYEWQETYEVRALDPSLYEFFSNPDTAIFRKEQVNICYASAKSSGITIQTTANLIKSQLSEMPIRYITTETDHLRYAYSILVRQYAISAEAFNFYREIQENNQGNGSLFDEQLGVVAGNVSSMDDPEETVLGFFEVSGVNEKRAFFEFKDLDPRFPWPNPQYSCEGKTVLVIDSVQPLPYKLEDSIAFYVRGNGYEITTAAYCDSLSVPPEVPPCPYYFRARMAPKYCTDCRFRGPVTKPDFWIY